jgi:hypothetical protein
MMAMLAVMASGCQKLTENPAGSLTNGSFFKSINDLDAAVTGAYCQLYIPSWNGFTSSTIWAPLMGSDDITTLPAGKDNLMQADRFQVSNTNTGINSVGWTTPYSVIYAANNVLESYHTVKGDQAAIDDDVAQVRFLRAWAYFWMVRLYGEIPIITSTQVDYTAKKSPVKDVYDFIVTDLQSAIDNLPDSRDAANVGKPTSWSAKALLSKVYLTMAGWPLKDESKYALAAQTAKDVIDNGPYQLLPHFPDVFLIKNKNAADVIWAIQCGKFPDVIPPYVNSQPGFATDPSEESGWEDMFAEVGFYKRFPAGPRKEATFYTVTEKGVPWTQWSSHHPFYAKYRDGTVKGTPDYEYDYWASHNVILLRYAELLLIYAEAQDMSAGSPDASAYEAINKVRRRAMDLPINVPNIAVDLQQGLSKAAFQDSVVAEKGWELAGEYNRWFDLVRTEKVEAMVALKDPLDMKPLASVSKEDYLMPVPYSETVLDPNLK